MISADLESKEFPYNFREIGVTVVVPSVATPNSVTPQILYADNVFPLARGYTSVGFTGHIPAIPSLAEPIIESFKISSSEGSLAYLVVTATKFYIFDVNSPSWQVKKSFPSSTTPISFANIKGEFYIFIPSLYQIVQYNFAAASFTDVTLAGIDMTDVFGISDAGDRMLMYSYSQIYWSSVFDPLDFIPSLSTGAGSSSVIAIKSIITAVVSLGQDFIIYTAQNAVGARATGDFNFPYIFAEIVGSAGAVSSNHIAYNSNSQVHLVWTYSGFQEVTPQRAQYAFPDLSDGIIRGIRFQYSQGVPYIIQAERLEVLLRFASNRWLCISVKDSTSAYYTDCYVLDTLLGRWGKLTVQHVGILEYWPIAEADRFTYDDIDSEFPTYNDFVDNYRETFGVDLLITPPTPGDNFGIVTPAGAIFTAAPSETANYRGGILGLSAETPKIILGNFKVNPNAGVRLEEIRVNDIKEGTLAAFSNSHNGSINRKSALWEQNSLQKGTFTGTLIGDSVSIEISGVFRLTQLQLELYNAGKLNMPMVSTELQYTTIMVETAHVFVEEAGVVDTPIPVNRSNVEQIS